MKTVRKSYTPMWLGVLRQRQIDKVANRTKPNGLLDRLIRGIPLLAFLLSLIAISLTLRQLALNEESFDVSNRAWLVPSAEFVDFRQVHIQYENVGKTPALGFNHREIDYSDGVPGTGASEICGGPGGTDPLRPASASRVVYPPNHLHADSQSYLMMLKPMSQETIQEIIGGERTLWLRGCFAYYTMTSARQTAFCLYLDIVLDAVG